MDAIPRWSVGNTHTSKCKNLDQKVKSQMWVYALVKKRVLGSHGKVAWKFKSYRLDISPLPLFKTVISRGGGGGGEQKRGIDVQVPASAYDGEPHYSPKNLRRETRPAQD